LLADERLPLRFAYQHVFIDAAVLAEPRVDVVLRVDADAVNMAVLHAGDELSVCPPPAGRAARCVKMPAALCTPQPIFAALVDKLEAPENCEKEIG
jgi:hypothetical protein